MDIRFHKKASLYIHIPFCMRKCWYCDFYSCADQSFSIKKNTICEIIRQFEFFTEQLGRPIFETIYIGGGTPNSLPYKLLTRLLDHIVQYNKGEEQEFTLEANPELIDKSFLDCIEEYGVNRLSVGVQSFDKKALDNVGRLTGFKTINHSLDLIHQVWEGELNIDLLIGLPDADIDQCSSDIDLSLLYNPNHISLYSLSIEKGTKLASLWDNGTITLPPAELNEDCFEKTSLRLKKMGYNRYEVSNFARAEYESVHNIAYWMMKPYLGIGPSAVSSLADSKNHCIRINNPRDLKSFTEFSDWGMQTEEIGGRDFLFEHLLMGFRTKRGVSREKIRSIFGLDLFSLCRASFSQWVDYLETSDNDAIHLNDRGLDLLNRFLMDVLDDLAEIDQKLPYSWM